MKTHQPSLHLSLLLASLTLALPPSAQADAYISSTAGFGPNSYRSGEVSGYADLFNTPLGLNMYGFKSTSSASENVSQSGIGLNWKISKLATLGAQHNKVGNGSIDINGNALSLAFSLNTLWSSDQLTRLDLKLGQSAYQFNDLPPTVNNDTIKQTASSLGLTQGITSSFSVYGSHDRYRYDRDPVNAAVVLLLNAPRRYLNTSSNLLGLPDTTNLIGITWRPLDPLTVDLSASKTNTMLYQALINKRMAIDYQATDHLNFSAAVSRATATEVVTKKAYILVPAGTRVMASAGDTYTELSLGWTF